MPIRCLIALAALALFACRAETGSGRFLYVWGCGGNVDKLDTAEKRKVASYDLTTRSGTPPAVPTANGTMDGCLLNDVVYDPAERLVYTASPTNARLDAEGSQTFRVLAFSVPDMQMVKVLPGNIKGNEMGVSLKHEAGQAPTAVKDSDVEISKPLQLAEFGPDYKDIANTVLETSGVYLLLRLFEGSPKQQTLAVANRETRKLVRLTDGSVINAAGAHLSPGGAAVLVDTVEGRLAAWKGSAKLYDSNSAALLKTIEDARGAKFYFLAIAQNGQAIYRLNDTYVFEDLGRKFESKAVTRMPGLLPRGPNVFFADR